MTRSMSDQVGAARLGGMDGGTAYVVEVDVFVGPHLDHPQTSDRYRAHAFDHDREVRERRLGRAGDAGS